MVLKMKRKRICCLPALLLCALLLCVGCGSKEAGDTEENTGIIGAETEKDADAAKDADEAKGSESKTEDESGSLGAGMAAIKELDYETALTCFEEALVSGEDARLVYRGQGLAYLGLTEYDKAAEALKKCLSVSSCVPDDMDYDVNYYLATAYYKAGRFQEAKEVYDAILELRPKERDAYFLRGITFLRMDSYEAAKTDFDRAVELDPENYDQLIEIYKELDKAGYREVGNGYLEKVLEEDSKSMSNYDKGRIYFYMEDFEAARNYLEQARDAGDAQAAYYLGKTWENLGEYNYAASVYNSYLTEKGGSALIYNQLALCQMQLEDYEAALEAIQAGLALEEPALKQTLSFNEIVILEKQGNFKEAASLMETYCKNYPDDEAAAREYEFLKTR